MTFQIYRTWPVHPAAFQMGTLSNWCGTNKKSPCPLFPKKVLAHGQGSSAVAGQPGVPSRGVGVVCLAEAEWWTGEAGGTRCCVRALSVPGMSHWDSGSQFYSWVGVFRLSALYNRNIVCFNKGGKNSCLFVVAAVVWNNRQCTVRNIFYYIANK